MDRLDDLIEQAMVLPFACVVLAGIYLTWKTRFVQVRAVPRMLRLLFAATPDGSGNDQVTPRAALLTAMSTTMGVGNVVGPMVAIGLGGPGALVCYVIATLLGGATIFSEVSLALHFRTHDADGTIHGGPMQYVRAWAPRWATVYAWACALLLLGWTAANANTIALTLTLYAAPRALSGGFVALAALAVLSGGIARVTRMNDKLVPLMCGLYCAATGWIIFVQHGAQVPAALRLIATSFWRPEAVGYGAGVASVATVLRHGLARALQANEAGVGTSSIPHGMVHNANRDAQATLAIAAAYFNGVLCLLTGLTVLVAGPMEHGMVLDITALSRIFSTHLSQWGGHLLSVSILLFAFGTIIGNSFNGAHCIAFLRHRAGRMIYYAACAIAIVTGAVYDFQAVFAWTDRLIVPVLLINLAALVIWAARGVIDLNLSDVPGTSSISRSHAARRRKLRATHAIRPIDHSAQQHPNTQAHQRMASGGHHEGERHET